MSSAGRASARCVDAEGLRRFVAGVAERRPLADCLFLCIGTDRSTGDSLGPWVGTLLRERGMKRVIGTLQHPCDADRLPEVIASLGEEETVVAIDACLGKPDAIGAFLVDEGPLLPARSVGRTLPPIGSYSVAGVVNATGPKPYWTLQSTSLHRVLGMAATIADAILEAAMPQSEPESQRPSARAPEAAGDKPEQPSGSSPHPSARALESKRAPEPASARAAEELLLTEPALRAARTVFRMYSEKGVAPE